MSSSAGELDGRGGLGGHSGQHPHADAPGDLEEHGLSGENDEHGHQHGLGGYNTEGQADLNENAGLSTSGDVEEHGLGGYNTGATDTDDTPAR